MANTVNEIKEDKVTRSIELQTAKAPSVGFLGIAVASMAVSGIFALVLKKRDLANFFGLWAPSILIMGVYNKLVKIEAEIIGPAELSGKKAA